MATYRCTQCGAVNTAEDTVKIARCPVCGGIFILPNHFEQKENLYHLAGDALAAKNFDIALNYYSRILKVDAMETQAHWGYLLSKYGVEVSQEAKTLNQIIFHRLEHTDFTHDPSYEKMIAYCPAEAKYYYERMSQRIDKQHRKMLHISNETQPFDIYLNCIAEKGSTDYMLANQVGRALDDAGYRVFLPCTMLDEIKDSDRNLYEMAVAEKSSAMIVVVTPRTDLNQSRYKAVWKRYLAYRRQDAERKLLSVYRDMKPEELPLELQPFQSMECSGGDSQKTVVYEINRMFGREDRSANVTRKILDLLRQGEQYLESKQYEEAKKCFIAVRETDAEESRAHWGLVCSATDNLQKPLLNDELDENYQRALRFAQPAQRENYQAVMRKLMCETVWESLIQLTNKFKNVEISESPKVKKAIERVYLYTPKSDSRLTQIDEYHRFALFEGEKRNLLNAYKRRDAATQPLFAEQEIAENEVSGIKLKSRFVPDKIAISSTVVSLISFFVAQILMVWHFHYTLEYTGVVYTISRVFFAAGALSLGKWVWHILDEKCKYTLLIIIAGLIGIYFCESRLTIATYLAAPLILSAVFLIQRLIGAMGLHNLQIARRRQMTAAKALEEVDRKIENAYKADMRTLFERYHVDDAEIPAYISSHSGHNDESKLKAADKTKLSDKPIPNILLTFGFLGAVIFAVTMISNFLYTSGWNNIVTLSPNGLHVVALKSNGKVVASGSNQYGQCNVRSWRDIVAIETGRYFTVGLTKDGHVLVAGGKNTQFNETKEWQDIVAISASDDHILGLKCDGTVVAAGSGPECDVENFHDVVKILALATGDGPWTLALTKDGTVLRTWKDSMNGPCEWLEENTGPDKMQVSNIYGKNGAIILVSEDGRCQGLGVNRYKQLSQMENWNSNDYTDIFVSDFTSGLRKDGTLDIAGNNVNVQAQATEWSDITAISGCVAHMIGLKSDGTVLAMGDNNFHQNETDGWTDIVSIYTGEFTSFGIDKNGKVSASGYGVSGMTYLTPRSPIGVLQFWFDCFNSFRRTDSRYST